MGVTVIDQLTGEIVEGESGASVAELIEWRVRTADHPRADFRSRPLGYQLLDGFGQPMSADRRPADGERLTLVGSEAAEVRGRRDRWLDDIGTRGTATTSVSTATHLALVERTGSRIADVQRLRIETSAERVAPPAATGASARSRALLLVGLGVVLLASGVAVWLVAGRDGGTESVASEGPQPPPEGVLAMPVDLELQLVSGTTNRTLFEGTEGQNVVILMLAPMNQFRGGIDSELELFDADGIQIGYNDDRLDQIAQPAPNFNFLNSRIDITLPADGVYEVVSGDLNDSNGGVYQLVIESEGPGGDGFNGGFMPDGEMMFEEEAMAMEEDVMAIERGAIPDEGPRPEDIGCAVVETIEIELPYEGQVSAGCEVASLGFEVADEPALVDLLAFASGQDPIIWVRAADGQILAYNDDSNGLNSRLSIELEPGSYELLVGNLAGEPTVIDVVVEGVG